MGKEREIKTREMVIFMMFGCFYETSVYAHTPPKLDSYSTATKHGGTHRGNRLLRATAAHTHSPHSAAQVSRVHCVHTTGPSGMSHRTGC